MLTTPVQGNGTPNRWTPAPYMPPAAQYQAFKAPSPKLGDTPISAAETLARSPVLAFGTDMAASLASAYLAWGLNVRRNTCLVKAGEKGYPIDKCPGSGWSTFWWIMSTAMFVKALHDLSEMNA